MIINFEEVTNRYTELLNESEKFNYIVRDSDIQKDMVSKLSALKEEIKGYKDIVIKIKKDEFLANQLFHLQCVLNAKIENLELWLNLKSGNLQEAWSNIVNAQTYVTYALKIEGKYWGISEYRDRLETIEKVIFPGFPLYNSWGMIQSGGTCSICEEKLRDCEHLEGKIYWGKVCLRQNAKPIRVDHSALVEVPKDRRCIITGFRENDKQFRDYITWKLEDIKPDDPSWQDSNPGTPDQKHLFVRSVLFVNKALDLY